MPAYCPPTILHLYRPGGLLTASTVLLAGSAGVVVVTTLFGAGGAGLAAYKMERRLGAVTEFRFLQPKVVEEMNEVQIKKLVSDCVDELGVSADADP